MYVVECEDEDIKHELYQAKKAIQKKEQCGTKLPSILDLNHTKRFSISFFYLCRIAIALPGSNASCELGFSALNIMTKKKK